MKEERGLGIGSRWGLFDGKGGRGRGGKRAKEEKKIPFVI